MTKQWRLWTVVALVGLGVGVSPGVSIAATFNVNSSADLPDRDTTDGTCEATFNQNDCTVRAAIMEANAQAGTDTINLQGGTVDLTQSGASPDTESIGDLDITDDVNIVGNSPTVPSRLDGLGTLGDRILEVRGGAVVTITDTVVEGGDTTESGGAIRVSEASDLTLDNVSVLSSSTTASAGGISVAGSSVLLIQDSTVSQNNAGVLGGGIRCQGGTVDILDSEVENNAAGAGGGVSLDSCDLTVDGSLIASNQATSTFWGGHGGGLLVRAGSAADIANSTISGNDGVGDGGGLYIADPVGFSVATADLNNVTVAFNHADGDGGGIFVASATAGGANPMNTIIDENTADGSGPDCGGADLDSDGYNLIGDTTGCTIVGTTTGNLTNQDAGLSTALGLNDDGTGVTSPTRNHALLPDSNAIDSGDDATCASTDQRGVSRPIPSTGDCDMGAFEAPECGNGVISVPEQCDDGNLTDDDGCESNCTATNPVSGHDEPVSTKTMTGGLVTAYEDCESPSLTTTTSGPSACLPVRSDIVCGFQDATGANGDFTVKSVNTGSGRVEFDVDLTKLDPACDGETLRISVAINETVEDCTGGGSCTLETREVDEDDIVLVSSTCTVSSDQCHIDAELNPTASTPKVAEGRRAGIEIRRFKVVRELSGGGVVDSFVPGIFHD